MSDSLDSLEHLVRVFYIAVIQILFDALMKGELILYFKWNAV